MKIIRADEIPQRSEAWHALHVGRCTASEFHRIVTPAKLELSKQRFDYAYRLAAERLLNQTFAKSLDGLEWVELGKEQEGDAVGQYQALTDVETYPVSFIIGDDERLGCSPDRLVLGDDRHGLEVKCCFPPKMVRYLIEGPDADYRIQLLGQFHVGQFERNDLFCYNRATPPYLKQWRRDELEADIAKVADHLDRFVDEVDAMVGKLNATGFFTKRAKPETLLEQMVAGMEGELMRLDRIGDIERWEADATNRYNLSMLPHEDAERLREMAVHRRAEMAVRT